MSNIKSYAIAQTATMPLRDVDGEPIIDAESKLPASITLYSPGSKEYQKAKHSREERNNNRVFARMQGKADTKVSAEDAVKERAEFLASCTVSLNNFDYEGMAGYEGYKAMYSDIEIGHIADDVDKFIADRANFKKGSTKP